MKSAIAGALAIALGGLACGCGTGWASSAPDYLAYRATRVSPTFEERLAAAQRYLRDRPDGAFRAEVRASFIRGEEVYYASKRGSRTGLAAYLAALPDGPHAEDAALRIQELDAIDSESQMDRLAAEVEARTSGPGAAARARVRKELDDWIGRFLDPGVFRVPLVAAPTAVIVPFSLSLPSPRCSLLDPPESGTARRCSKLLEFSYDVDRSGKFEAREATLEITLFQDRFGVPREVDLGGPDLFLRLEETYRIRPVTDADRPAANVRAATFVRRAFARRVSDPAACDAGAQPPAALRLACKGIQIELFPAPAPGQDDLIVIVATKMGGPERSPPVTMGDPQRVPQTPPGTMGAPKPPPGTMGDPKPAPTR